MTRILALLLFAVNFSSVPAATPRSLQAEDLSVKLSKRVSTYDIGRLSLVGALVRVSNDFQIPMGIVWVNAPSARAERPFVWNNATIQEIIQTIANTQPGYQFQVRNGVVHVFPQISDDQNFLKIKIAEFNVHNVYAEMAYFKLRALVKPPEHGNRLFSIAGPGDSKVTVELKNPSIEDALDALAVTSNRKIWIVTFIDDPSLSPRGFRRVGSLWSNKATPDEEQPRWDLLRWGDPMPSLLVSSTSPSQTP
jgi:hypothetical protein